MMRSYIFHPGYWGMDFGFFPILFMVAFWILVILAIVALIKSVSVHNDIEESDDHEVKMPKKDNKYLEIVKERYARGEINKKDFDQLKKDFE